jgi:glutamine synthetase
MSDAYSAMNPISSITGKGPRDLTRRDLVRVIEEKQIERISFHYTALDGKLKELKLPIANRRQAERILADGERVDGSSLFKGMVDVSLSDLYVVPVYRTAFLNPFDPRSLDFICRYLTHDGVPAPFTLDNVLHNAHDLFRRNTGLELQALGELEFFLIGDPPSHIYSAPKQRGYHASSPFIKTGEILNEIVHHITRITGSVKYAHSEVGYVEHVGSDLEELRGKQAEQLEVEFLPTPVEDTGDILVLARWLIRNIAYKYGLVATFAPKLEEGIAGNGFHVHVELHRDGRNVMADETGGMTEPGRRMIGGLCHYADSLTSFGNTVSSAYLRLVPRQEAPTRICWSDRNRSAMIRVPLGWSKVSNLAHVLNAQQKEDYQVEGSRQTVELRSPDGSALVHLLLAGITMAAEWGLTHEESLELAEKHYMTGNIFEDERLLERYPPLPKSCVASSRILLEKRKLYERNDIFPPGVVDYVARILAMEDDERMNQVLSDLPADDRLHETRKIMHKSLHRH